ncbi:hypothetical protein SAMN04488056_10980 [Cohaesibacter marisflavi]|uniref:Uncharacterized protein n=1 Tax=Cohaesibacter marisflavi TaxID=655353 RepID=A0A1I5IN26_9HYPH|nr:hypothetical protein [Cohaesibacter marisflavi]SFO61606.1 hypothetical protein SAMN04488056_10980 [Cohaesibacter marisflavi]
MSFGAIGDFAVDSLRNRFCYWQSDSGNRYIFTQIPEDDISSFENCILLLATENADKLQPELKWIGEISDLSPLAFRDIAPEDVKDLVVYVHLLAGSEHERQQVIDDLARDAGREICLLSA